MKRGGIARFLQHLPKDSEKRERDLLSRFLDVDYVVKKRLIGGGLPWPPEIVARTIAQRRQDLEQIAKETAVSEYDSELDDCIFSDRAMRSQIAVRNVRIKHRIVEGKSLLVLVTLYAINKGEQLGLSYRNVVSTNVRRFPEFFDLKGNILSHSLYKRKWVQLSFKSQVSGTTFLTPRFDITTMTNIQSITSKIPHLSPYQIRRYLIRGNVMGVEKLLPIQPTTFALHLIELLNHLSIDASAQTFFRSNNLNANKLETYIVDVVCHLKGLNKSKNQKKLKEILLASTDYIQFYPASHELIFKGTNVTPNLFQDIIRTIMNRK